MYGLVNRAIEELVIAEAGRSIWETIKRKAGVTVPSFVSMKPYPDAMTYDLVAAASEVMEVPADELLRAFGKHWILFTAAQGYGPALEMAGSDLREFVGNLDALHRRVAMTMPELVPPSFVVSEAEGGEIRVRYHSEREGLAPMVLGLLEGLGEMFETPVRVEQVAFRGAESEFDEFALIAAKPDSA